MVVVKRFAPFVLLFCVSALFPEAVGTLLLTNTPMKESPGDLMLLDLKNGRIDTLVKAVDSMTPYGPCFSPDGRKVAYRVKKKYGADGNRIRIIDLFTRVITGVGPDIPLVHIPLSWAGKYIYCAYGWSLHMQRVNVETGIIDTVFTFTGDFDKNYQTNPAYTPGIWGQGNVSRDGKRGAYTLTRAGNMVYSFDTTTRLETQHIVGSRSCQAAMSPNGEWVVATQHSANMITRYNNNSEVYRSIYGYNFWFNRWSYNSDNDLVFCNMNDTSFYWYHLDIQKCEFLIKGFCVWNMDVRGWVLDTVAPSAPTGLTALPTDNAITLSWTAPVSGTPPTGYVIERNGVRIGTVSTATFTDVSLTPSTSYNYAVYGRTNGVALSAPLSGTFSTTADITPPKIVGAYAFGTTVDLIFNEPLNAASAAVVSNYTITPSLSVSAAVLTAPKRVRLTTGNTNALAQAVIRVSGLRDAALNAVIAETDSLSIVSNLWVSTGRVCGWAAIDSATLYWTDDDNPPARMPFKSPLYGDLPFLQTSIRDGTVNADSNFLKFNLNRRMMVMVIGGAPWCNASNGWTATGNSIGDWPVSTKVFEPGQVILKGRGGTVYSTYVVGFKNADSASLTLAESPQLSEIQPSLLVLTPSPVISGRICISYQILKAGHVQLAIYNTQGRLINKLVNAKQGIGGHQIVWAGTRHQRLRSGVYFCVLTVDKRTVKTERFVVVK